MKKITLWHLLTDGTSLLSHAKICTNPKTPIMHLHMHTRHIMYTFLMENLEHFLELEKTFKPQAQIDFFTNLKIAYKQLVSTIGSIDA